MKKEVKMGILGIVSLAIGIFGYKYLKGQNVFGSSNIYYAVYDHLSGIQVSNPVMISGFQVGAVVDVYPQPDNLKKFILEFEVDNKFKLPKNTVAAIESASVMGGYLLNLNFEGSCKGSDCAEDGSFLKGETKGLVATMLGLDNMKEYSDVLVSGLKEALTVMTDEMNNPQSAMGNSIKKLDDVMSNVKGISANLNRMISDASPKLSGSLENLESLSATLKDSNGKIELIISNVEALSSDLKDSDVDGTVASAKDAIEGLKSTLESANAAIADLGGVIGKAKNGEGTLGKLLTDEELYNTINELSNNINILAYDLRIQPKRYLGPFGKKKLQDKPTMEVPESEQKKD